MWYQNRYELDRISEAGAYHYFADNGNPIVRMNASFWLECEKDDTAFTQPAINTGNWEAWVATAIMRELHEKPDNKGAQFLDVGANNGYYSIMAATAGFYVTSFEPDPTSFEILNRNVALNKLNAWHYGSHYLDKKIKTYNVAVSDIESHAFLHQHENHSGANSLEGEGDQGVEVQTYPLSYFFPGDHQCHIIKVDVEGHERNVWDGYTASKETTRTLMKDGTTQDFHFGDDIWFVEWVPCRHGIDYNREWLEEVLETHDLQMVNYDGTLRPVGIEEALDVEFETIVFRKRN